jgi:DNA-binding NtrC family response regulator
MTMTKLQDKLVLIIDDDAGMLRALDKVLTGEGATVIRAQWAVDAMEFLTGRKIPVELVITDLRMPFVTGITVVYAIHEVFPNLPVIVLTAFGSPDVKAECLRQGAAAFLEKPLNTMELMAAVAKVFASHPAAPEPAKPGQNGRNDFADENFEPQKNRLNARRLLPGRQDYDPDTGTGEAKKKASLPEKMGKFIGFREAS